ncbi:hypothetical protein [Lysinibacillus xylanilyticus]|uniref:hypothetical protein n=1 Tax=Lysinibacillus xylanilyticus TaxID=582475 RepID=UPI00381393DE
MKNNATINENTTYEEVVKIFGGPGVLVKKGSVREAYKWGSSLNKDTAYISFVKKTVHLMGLLQNCGKVNKQQYCCLLPPI